MLKGNSIELNALRESWRCRKCQKIGYCMFGLRQGIPSRDRVQEMPRTCYCWFYVAIRNSWSTEFFLALCRDMNKCVATWFQILSHKNCRNMAFFVATGVLVLCRDDVATEVFLSRSRRSQREAKVATGAWLRPRDFKS